MKHLLTSLVTLLLAVSSSHAASEPLAIGFDRFHAMEPSADGGRLLFNELGCVNCHGVDTGLPARRGPELGRVTQRVREDWLRKFLANPSTAHEGTTMPTLLSQGDVEPVLHYLMTLRPKASPKPKTIRHVNTARGSDLYHTIGCTACHVPGKDFQPPDGRPKDADFTYRSVVFPDLSDKHVLSSLSEFILDPLKMRTDGRMPRTDMDEQDAVDIAGYLLNFEGSDGTIAPKIPQLSIDSTLAEQGRGIVAALRCAACHELPKAVAVKPVPLQRFSGGCLSETEIAGIPRYELSLAQRASLSLFLQKQSDLELPHQLAALTLESLNCLACHERDGRGGPDEARKAYFLGDHNLGDVGRYPPPLSSVGRKLQPDWFRTVLSGESRIRPYLRTKMPNFGQVSATLPALLAGADEKKETPLPPGDDAAGRKLLGTIGGMGCITCHRWGEHAALGIQSLELSRLGQRLQPGWLREYLVNPAAYRPGTLMPSFWPDGKSAKADLLDGDTDRQIASIYSYTRHAIREPEGFPAKTGEQFELIPKDHPIVLRTFMQDVGTHAILVGFPAGTHLAFDGERARPALAWKGKFFDAYNTWFSRFAPFEKPLGSSVVKWPEPAPGDAAMRFEGYRLDAKRVPIFIWSVDDVRVEERFDATDAGLRRSLVWDAAALKSPPISHPQGVSVSEEQTSVPGNRIFTYGWK